MKSAVVGQTGKIVLSANIIQYKQSKKRMVRYQYTKLSDKWMAWVCGPFHSRTYGAPGFGTNKKRAKAALRDNLARNYGYLGIMMFSDVDESDTVGIVDERLLDDNAIARPITHGKLVIEC